VLTTAVSDRRKTLKEDVLRAIVHCIHVCCALSSSSFRLSKFTLIRFGQQHRRPIARTGLTPPSDILQLVASQSLDILLGLRTTFLTTWRSAGALICLSVTLLVAIGNDVLIDPVFVGSIKFGGTETPHQWNSGGMPYDVVMVLERRNGPRRLRNLIQRCFVSRSDTFNAFLFKWLSYYAEYNYCVVWSAYHKM